MFESGQRGGHCSGKWKAPSFWKPPPETPPPLFTAQNICTSREGSHVDAKDIKLPLILVIEKLSAISC